MKSELTYLLEELENWWADNDEITVQDLKKMINRSFRQQAIDQQRIDDSMNEIGHDMM